MTVNHLLNPKKKKRRKVNYDYSARKKKKTMTCLRAYLIRNHQTHMTRKTWNDWIKPTRQTKGAES